MAKLNPTAKAPPVADLVAAAAPHTTPASGGSYIRQPDGSFERVATTFDAVEPADPATLQPTDEPQK